MRFRECKFICEQLKFFRVYYENPQTNLNISNKWFTRKKVKSCLEKISYVRQNQPALFLLLPLHRNLFLLVIFWLSNHWEAWNWQPYAKAICRYVIGPQEEKHEPELILIEDLIFRWLLLIITPLLNFINIYIYIVFLSNLEL